LPKEKEEIFKYQLNWSALARHEVFDKVCRPWIGKKIKEFMGVEELSVI
jgi:hypothetical protein